MTSPQPRVEPRSVPVARIRVRDAPAACFARRAGRVSVPEASCGEKAVVFTLHISQAVFIDWDIEHSLMTTHRWSPASGYAVASRIYP
jgi:hypothetical protein